MSAESSAGLFSTFGSYDFFGKSIPGVLTVVLTTLSLPLSKILSKLSDQNLPVLAILLVLLILLGFVVGQGLHTVAVLVEKILFSIGKRVLRFNRRNSGPTSDWFKEKEKLEYSNKLDVSRVYQVYAILFNFTVKLRKWIWPRYVGVKHVFKPHRVLFEERLKRIIDGRDVRVTSVLFFEGFNRVFEKEIAEIENLDGTYSLVLSYINTAQANDRSGRFQASYTFCRSIWVVLLGFSLVYLIGYIDIFPEYAVDSAVELYLTRNDLVLYFSASLLLLSIPFMYAAGAYKTYFIQYIFADFANASISE